MPIDLPTPTPDRLHQEPTKLHIDQANELFYSFMQATTCSETLKFFSEVKSKLNISEPGYANLLPLRKFITKWQAKKFLDIFTKHANQKDYYDSLTPDRIVYEDVNKHYFPSPFFSSSTTTSNLTTGLSHAKKSKTAENNANQSGRNSYPYSSNNSTNIPNSSSQFAESSVQKKSSSSTALPSHATHRACSECNALIVGAGPVGLRTAIELSLLGCNTVVVELREEFTRLNLVHLWKSAVADLKSLGIKKIFGQFCNGELNHIAISKLQLCLLKLSLIAGVEVFTGTRYQTTRHPASQQKPWKPTTQPELPNSCPVKHRMDVLIGADGKETMIPGFDMKTLRGKLAIGLTVNFKNSQTENEKSVEEIPGIGYQYKRPWFDKLKKIYNIGLENIVYYKNEHHYFVMTPKKESLLARGVFKQDHGDVSELLSWKNIDKDRLEQYARDTVNYATNDKLKGCEFMINSRGQSDCGLFDFTSMWQAKHASITRQVNKYGRPLLTQLIGDSLLNPFWPMGTGIGRGFQSGFDAAWLVKQFEIVKSKTLNQSGISDFRINAQVEIAKRELVYNHIFTSLDKEFKNLIEPWSRHTIDPQTRYPEYKNVIVKAGALGSKIGKQNWYMADEAKKSLSRPSISRSILVENGDYGVNGASGGSSGLTGYNGSNFNGSNGLNGIMSPISKSTALKALNSSPYPQNSPRKQEVQEALDSYSSERSKKNSKRRSNERTKKILIQSSPKSAAMIDKLIHSLNNMIGESTEYGFKVEDCGTSWRSGRMLAALLHSHNSELFNYHRTIARLNSTPKLIQEMIDICKTVFNVKFVEKYEDLMLVGTDEGVSELDLAYSLQMLLREFRHKKNEQRRNREKNMTTSSANGQLLDSDICKNAGVPMPKSRNIEIVNYSRRNRKLDVTDSNQQTSDFNQVSGTDISGNAPTSPKSSPLRERTTPVLTGGKPILNKRVSPRKTRRSMTMTITNSYDTNYSTPETTEIKYENEHYTPKNAPKKLVAKNNSRLNNSNLDEKVVEKLISEKMSEVTELKIDSILEKSKTRRASRKMSTDQIKSENVPEKSKSENSKLGKTTEEKNLSPPLTPITKIDVQSTFTPENPNPLDNSFTDRKAQLTSWRKKRQYSNNALRQKSEPPARQNSEPTKNSPEVQKLTPTKASVRRSVTAEFNKLDNAMDRSQLKLPDFKTPFKVSDMKESETSKFRKDRSGTVMSEFDNYSPAQPEQLMYTPMKSLENFKALTPQSPKHFRTPEYRRENGTHSIQSPSFTDLPGTPYVSKLKSTKNQENREKDTFQENNSIHFVGLDTISPQPNTVEKIENDSPNFKIRRRRTKKLSESDPQYRSSSESLSKNFSSHNSRNNSPKPELQSKSSKRSSLASPNTSENILMNDLNKYKNDSVSTHEPRNDTVDLTTISLLDEDSSYSTLRTSSTIVVGLDKVNGSLEQINVFDQINQNLMRKGQKCSNLEINKKVSPIQITPISSDLNSAFHFPECKTPNNLDSDVEEPATEEFYTPQLTSTNNLHMTNLHTTNLQTNFLRDSLEKLNDFPVKSRSRIRRARTARANTTSIVYSSKENTPESMSSINSTPKTLTTPKTPELPKRASLAETPRRIFVTPEPDSQAPRISKLKKVVAKPLSNTSFRRSSADYLDHKTIDKDSTSDQLFYTPMAKTPFKPSLFKTQPPESPLNSAFLGDTTHFGDSTHNYSSITTPSQDLSSFSTPSPTKSSLSRERPISGLKLRPEKSAEKRRERREKSRTMNIIYVDNRAEKNDINFDKENESSDDVDPALARIRDNTNKLNELTRQAKQLSLDDGEIQFGEITKKIMPVENKSSRDSKKSRDSKRNEVLARTEKRDKERRFQKSLSIQSQLDETKDLLDEIERQNTDFERSSSFDDGGNNNAENVNKWIQLLRMRKNFVTKQDRLKNELRELQLQDKQAELHKKLRNMKLDTTLDSSKFEAQRELTEQITEIVYQRDRLVKTIADLRGEEELSQSTLQFK